MITSSKLRKIRRMQKIKRQRQHALVLILVLTFVIGSFTFANIGSANEKFNVASVSIKNGDTLWSIAMEYKPYGKDIREFCTEISELNKIDNATLIAGQTIYIPQ